jgi:hypothetical protein
MTRLFLLTQGVRGALSLALLVGCARNGEAPCSGGACDGDDEALEPVEDAAPPPDTAMNDGSVKLIDAARDQPKCIGFAEGLSCEESTDAAQPAAHDATTAAASDGGSYMKDGLECFRIAARHSDGHSKLKVGIALDAYYMIVVAPPWSEPFYGVVVSPIIDNEKVLHHWLLYQDNVPGVPTPPVLQIGAHPTGQLLAGWAPGADSIDFRKTGQDVSIELTHGTTYTLELHYNSRDAMAEDASGVEICGQRKKTKHVAGISWLGYDQLAVPATVWRGTCRPISLEPIHITHVWPHMHLTGKHMKATIVRADGKQEILHDEDFDFNYQRSYAKNVTLMPGDRIDTECTYTQPAVWGQPTNLEMCYLFTTAYPKGALQGFDIWGTVAHGSSSCLGM